MSVAAVLLAAGEKHPAALGATASEAGTADISSAGMAGKLSEMSAARCQEMST